ncbi:MAG: hypothetical protein H7Y33_16260 [Cytophagales bacterium]|nr:hypothetical protein [Rhizobacter sp.]
MAHNELSCVCGDDGGLMLKEVLLIAIVMAAGATVSMLWPQRKLWAGVLCVLTALLVVWLAKRWHIDLSGVS